jgi:hypothetical protein
MALSKKLFLHFFIAPALIKHEKNPIGLAIDESQFSKWIFPNI